MTSRIVIVGSSNTDMIVKAAKLPLPGETVLGGEFSRAAGGKGANQAVAAARAGAEVHFIGCVGSDQLGDEAIRGLREDGIKTEHVKQSAERPSGVALIMVDGKGENCIAVAPGANAELAAEDVEKAGEAFAGAGIALIQLEIPLAAVEAAARMAAASGCRVILNPAPARELSEGILQHVDILTPNRTELAALTGMEISGKESLNKASQSLLDRGVKTVVVTLGADGAYIRGPEHEGMVPGFKVDPVDTTAAGDTFNGALAAALVEGMPFNKAVEFANAAAALSVTRLGAQPSIPRREEIDKLLKDGSRGG